MTLPVFETPRLTLRSITAHDAEGLHEAYGDADAMRYWDHPPSRDVSQTSERIRVSAEADPRLHGMWAIQTHERRFVGAINYHARNEQQRRLALGWIVVPSCWRQGLMTEAAPPVISHCFTQLKVHRIEARIEPDNISSRRLAAKARLHRGRHAARLALRRGRVPQHRDVQFASAGVDDVSVRALVLSEQRSRPC